MIMRRYSAFAPVAVCVMMLAHSLFASAQKNTPSPEVKVRANGRLQEKRTMRGGAPVDGGLKRYMNAIAERNLFLPLGSGRQEEKASFALTAVMSGTSSGSDNKAIIEEIGGRESYYVSEGDIFADEVKVVDIDEQRVRLDAKGEEMELRLGEGTSSNRRRGQRSKKDSGAEGEQRPRKDEGPDGGFWPGDPGQAPPFARKIQGERGVSIQELQENPELQFRIGGGSGSGQTFRLKMRPLSGEQLGEVRIIEVPPSAVKDGKATIIIR
jgi:hypothetical protein